MNYFSKGQIWYYSNPYISKKDYADDRFKDCLTTRPVLIIQEPEYAHWKSSVTVIPLTSSPRRSGINIPPISCNDYIKHPYSKVMPYKILSINTKYLKTYLGTLDSGVMKKIDEAIKFHLGYSHKIPQYVTDWILLESDISNIMASNKDYNKHISDIIDMDNIAPPKKHKKKKGAKKYYNNPPKISTREKSRNNKNKNPRKVGKSIYSIESMYSKLTYMDKLNFLNMSIERLTKVYGSSRKVITVLKQDIYKEKFIMPDDSIVFIPQSDKLLLLDHISGCVETYPYSKDEIRILHSIDDIELSMKTKTDIEIIKKVKEANPLT